MAYWGCDGTSTAYPSGCSKDFYIGQSGYGNVAPNFPAWNPTVASEASIIVYTYWMVWGPGPDPVYKSNPSGYTASDANAWGKQQAEQANNGIGMVTDQGPVPAVGLTLWADIEGGSGNGWVSNTALNTQVLIGFNDYLASVGVTPGVYSGLCLWSGIMGTTKLADVNCQYSWTKNYSWGSGQPDPCSSLTFGPKIDVTCTQSGNYVMAQSIDQAQAPTFWQYTQDYNYDSHIQDWDMAIELVR